LTTITKRFKIDFAHQLPGYNGKCSRLHGHTGYLEITLCDHPSLKQITDYYDGMIIDFYLFKKKVQPLLDDLDHRSLNDILERPTAENVLDYSVDMLTGIFPEALYEVKFYESTESWVTWKR
jgi:6-pyruvoyltetrahydropterin/6-carboxytetrahydropterin synthase